MEAVEEEEAEVEVVLVVVCLQDPAGSSLKAAAGRGAE